MKTEERWLKGNPFFGCKEGYEVFVEAMMAEADNGNLPVCLKHEDPECLTMQDIKQFSQLFMQDTGLNLEFRISSCNDCGGLHCHLIVDEFPEDEKESDENDWN